MLDEGVDLVDQFLDVGEQAAADGPLPDEAEPAFDLGDLGRVSRSVVHVVPVAPGQPGLDLGVLVDGVVVDHEMNVETHRHALVDMPQEEELLVPAAALALGKHLSSGDVEGSEEGGSPVAAISVRHLGKRQNGRWALAKATHGASQGGDGLNSSKSPPAKPPTQSHKERNTPTTNSSPGPPFPPTHTTHPPSPHAPPARKAPSVPAPCTRSTPS